MSDVQATAPSSHRPYFGLSKTCSHCHTIKPLDQFYRNCGTKDGRGSWCRLCEGERDRTTYLEAYRQTVQCKTAFEKYQKSPKGQQADREYLRRQRREHPEKARARDAVKYALRVGRLIRPSFCESCSVIARCEAHHDDYARRLDVRWLCKVCHIKADSDIRDISPAAKPGVKGEA